MALNIIPRAFKVDNADTSTTGVKLSYTTPKIPTTNYNRKAYVISASWRTNAGTAPTVQLQILSFASQTLVLAQSDANGHIFIPGCAYTLLPGDTIQFNVTATGAGSNGDGYLSIDEVA